MTITDRRSVCMARVRDFDRTRTLLINVASELFATQGYDPTSVDRIVTQAGMSKGAFYHHFCSKDDLLDAVCASMVGDAMDHIRAAVAEVSAGAIVRFNRFLNSSRVWRLAHFGLVKEVLTVLHRDENAPMLRKLEAHSTSLSVPLLGDILQQGIDEGVFDPPQPYETARLILQLSAVAADHQLRMLLESQLSDEALAVLQHRADLFIEMVSRMLGAPKGAIERLQFTEALRSMQSTGAGNGAPPAPVKSRRSSAARRSAPAIVGN
jgi:AcrR family transcriptional regulator